MTRNGLKRLLLRLHEGEEEDRARLVELTSHLDEIRLMREALTGLAVGWRQADPGKDGPNWFFVKKFSIKPGPDGSPGEIGVCERFWAVEFVDGPQEKRRGPNRNTALKRRVNGQTVQLGRATEAADLQCPGCDRRRPVIGRYEQTEDSPFGDHWQLDLFVLCTDCPCLSFVAHSIRADRFL